MSRPVLTAVPSPSSGSRTRLPRAVRRTQLLDAAGAIITQQGFDELDRLYRRMGDALNEHAPFEEQVRAAVRAYFDLVEERGPLLDVLGAHLTGPASRSERRRRQPFVRELAGLVQHEFDVQPRRARELSALLMSVSATSAWMWRAYGMPRAEVEEVCVAFMLAGVAAASDA
jgi:AcrR family transcriptional regulator